MYDNLKSLGITNPEEIDRYSLRQEANNDILKIYFQKDKGEFFVSAPSATSCENCPVWQQSRPSI